ncbi:hypothetical protein BC834DRAFT_969173 [Gloeopeniophorella convolvens]|nr:hypothetical protein BC834DRAFT_969173 [Gloeopeniophorella convolvens]
MKYLPNELNLWLNPDTKIRCPPGEEQFPQLWYGIGFNHEHLAAYAKKRNIWRQDDSPYTSKLFSAEVAGGPMLRRATGWSFLEIRAPYSKQYVRMVAIYSNYWMNEQLLDARSMGVLLDRIRREFDIDGEPMWYYDRLGFDWEYLETFPQRYAERVEKERRQEARRSKRAARAARAVALPGAPESKSAAESEQ